MNSITLHTHCMLLLTSTTCSFQRKSSSCPCLQYFIRISSSPSTRMKLVCLSQFLPKCVGQLCLACHVCNQLILCEEGRTCGPHTLHLGTDLFQRLFSTSLKVSWKRKRVTAVPKFGTKCAKFAPLSIWSLSSMIFRVNGYFLSVCRSYLHAHYIQPRHYLK